VLKHLPAEKHVEARFDGRRLGHVPHERLVVRVGWCTPKLFRVNVGPDVARGGRAHLRREERIPAAADVEDADPVAQVLAQPRVHGALHRRAVTRAQVHRPRGDPWNQEFAAHPANVTGGDFGTVEDPNYREEVNSDGDGRDAR
jgi:hypothetical protein